MDLTQEYRTIRALFEGSENEYVEDSDPKHYPHGVIKYFQVGPIVYEIMIYDNGQYWNLSFKYHKMVGSTHELMKYFSRLQGEKISEYELKKIKLNAMYDPFGVLSLGKPTQVFGEMFLVLKQFIQTYQPKCFGFICKEKRVDLYDKMFSRVFPTSQWKKEIISHPGEKDFRFCRIGK